MRSNVRSTRIILVTDSILCGETLFRYIGVTSGYTITLSLFQQLLVIFIEVKLSKRTVN